MYKYFNQHGKWIFSAVISLLLLSACAAKQQPVGDPEYRRSVKVAAIERSLENKGVNVIHVGQTVRLTILSDALFNPRSANFNSRAAGILNTVAQLMLILQSTSAQVAGYTNTEYSEQINRALSARQAQVIVDYLWSRGVDSRLLYAVGKGSQSPLTSSSRAGEGINRRIEIQFQYLPLLSTLVN